MFYTICNLTAFSLSTAMEMKFERIWRSAYRILPYKIDTGLTLTNSRISNRLRLEVRPQQFDGYPSFIIRISSYLNQFVVN